MAGCQLKMKERVKTIGSAWVGLNFKFLFKMEQRHLKVVLGGDDLTRSGPCVHNWWLHCGAVILIK